MSGRIRSSSLSAGVSPGCGAQPLNTWAVIPTYNERENVGKLIAALFSRLPEIGVLIVDDNSPDGTAEIVRSLQGGFPRLELLSRTGKRGFGPAYRDGFRWILNHTEADAILMMDADLSHDPAYVPAMLRRIEVCDAVIGSRYAPGAGTAEWRFWRRMLSKGGNWYVRAVTGMPFRDCSSGFSAIRTELLRGLDLARIESSGYAFVMELKYLMWRSGAAVEEIPIVFRNRAGGESKLSGPIIREGLRAPWRVRARR